MPEVRALQSFYDMQDRAARNTGDEWYCEEPRAERLAGYGIVEILGLPSDEEPQRDEEPAIEAAPEGEAEAQEEPVQEQKPKKRGGKKKEGE